MNDFDAYQNASRHTCPDLGRAGNELHAYLGLAGDVGELLEKIKKVVRDRIPQCQSMEEVRGEYEKIKGDIMSEGGDILWHLARVFDLHGISMTDVALHNLEKIADRKRRGVLVGSGDKR